MRECCKKICQTLSRYPDDEFYLCDIKTLIIEDNRTDQEIISKIITKEGGNVLLANNGKMGFNIAYETTPDLIILDYYLPDENGDVVCRKLKKDKKTRMIPIIFLSINKKISDLIDCIGVGAHGFFEKPIDRELMLSEIKFTLQNFKI